MDQRNLIIAVVASIVILLGFQYFYELPRAKRQQAEQQQAQQTTSTTPAPAAGTSTQQPATAGTSTGGAAPALVDRATALARTTRVAIKSPRLSGSISLTGARIDDLVLTEYRVDVHPGSANVVLLSPEGALNAYWADFGWVGTDETVKQGVRIPDSSTVWEADGDTLGVDKPITLRWDNGGGLRFSQTFALDRNYMFTVTQRVENAGTAPATVFPNGAVVRIGTPKVLGFSILHEGLVGVLDGTLKEVKYTKVEPDKPQQFESTGGWLGITDKYWLVAAVPEQKERVRASFLHGHRNQMDVYQADFIGGAETLAPGASAQSESRLFAGAKEVKLLDDYRDGLGIPLFDRAVDFGGYVGFLLTLIAKPLFYLLDSIYGLVGNFGIAILLLTVLVKGVFFPLANKSYRAMSRMKALSPEMTKLRERFKDDKQRLQQEMMALYKREKVNPAAGCLPIVVQIPVFLALYQVLFVTIEMRQAPFFGWIRDLSVPDPTSILNLFGLAPWTVPDLGPAHIISIGIWPIIMGLTMFLQQKLNPTPPDPVQAKIFMLLPIIFTFMLAQFPAGLVIYWAWNNTLSIAQQRAIMWRMGVKA